MKLLFLGLAGLFLTPLAASALSPSSQEKLSPFRTSQTSFTDIASAFGEVASTEQITIQQLVAELQKLDPDFASELVKDQDFLKLAFLLDSGWNPNTPDSQQSTLLKWALQEGHFPIVNLLVRYGVGKSLKKADLPVFLRRNGFSTDGYERAMLRIALASRITPTLNNDDSHYLNQLQGDSRKERAEERLDPPTMMAPGPVTPPTSGFGAGSPEKPRYVTRQVPYVTNRAYDAALKKKLGTAAGAAGFYSFNSTEKLDYGIAEVTIPLTHKLGKLETPGIFERENQAKHVILSKLMRRTEAEFLAEIKTRLAASEEKHKDAEWKARREASRNLLIYVHGFNVSFSFAVRKTAQLMDDMEFPGVSVAFSWPAKAVTIPIPVDFRRDVLRAEESRESLESFLRQMLRDYPDRKIHLLAHSLGTRILTEALASIAEQPGEENAARLARGEKLFGEVVLAAPAIDAVTFEDDFGPKVAKLSERVSLFSSNADVALRTQTISETLKSFPLGLYSGLKRAYPSGMDSYDLSRLSGSFSIDHSLYSDISPAIRQLSRIYVERVPTSEVDSSPDLAITRRTAKSFFSGVLSSFFEFADY